VLLEESAQCVYKHLIKLQQSDETLNQKLLNACMRIVDYAANDEVTKSAVKNIVEV